MGGGINDSIKEKGYKEDQYRINDSLKESGLNDSLKESEY